MGKLIIAHNSAGQQPDSGKHSFRLRGESTTRFLQALGAIWLLPLLASACVFSVVLRDTERSSVQGRVIADMTPPPHESARAAAVPQGYALQAVSGATIEFKTQNGATAKGVPPQTLHLPHLVLCRNGALTDPDERTLIVNVTGVKVPPGGVTVTLKVETQHGDPDRGADSGPRIPVWRETRWISNTTGLTRTSETVTFRHTFGRTVMSGTETIATPTDYFRVAVTIVDAGHPTANPLHVYDEDHAFLMENQWIVQLPEVQEASTGAAPDELIVYYTDMFPLGRCRTDPSTCLRREEFPHYVQTELVPLMVEAFRVETDVWGFPWYQAWTGYRPGEDAERLSVALTDSKTWFHGKAPAGGHAGISINVNEGRVEYDSLTDDVMSTFYHELFHNLQRNIHLYYGGNGDLDGKDDAWQFFTEGTAVLASTVGQPDVQFNESKGARSYLSYARSFTGREGFDTGDLNASYSGYLTGYHAAIYWRFLYEQCGGSRRRGGVEDPAAGMAIARRALRALYSKEIVDISASGDLVGSVPQVMDWALKGSTCPFQTYEQSLTAFARAIYALRVEGGRCTEPGSPAGCGLYDPYTLYHDPLASTLVYTGTTLTYVAEAQPYPPGIPSSFGMDFVDVILDPGVDGQPLSVEFHGAPGADAAFTVQLWELKDGAGNGRPRPVPTPRTAPRILSPKGPNGHLTYVIPAIDTGACDRLGLIITRVDAKEKLDPFGEYTIVLRPG